MTSSAAGETAWRRPPHVAWVVDDGTAVLLHLPSGRRVALSETATAVWQALVGAGDAGLRVADVTPALAERFGADAAQVSADVQHLLDELLAAGLLEPRP